MNTPNENYKDSEKRIPSVKNYDYGIYRCNDSFYVYDRFWIHSLEWDSHVPTINYLLEEWDRVSFENLPEETKEQIVAMQNIQEWKILTYDQIMLMLRPNDLETSFNTLLWKSNFNNEQRENINRAKNIMMKSHKIQFRDEWLPYYVHPLKVANDLLKDNAPYEAVICWLLHDVIEDDKDVNTKELKEIFWENIVDIVLCLTKIDKETGKKLDNNVYMEKIWSNTIATTVKWYDRLNNIASTYFVDGEKKEKYIKETENIYIPFFEEHSPEIAEKIKEILKYIKTNPEPTEKELQQIRQVHESYILVNNIIK